MVVSETRMSEIISLRPRFLRSVHLERDFYAKDAADEFLMTRGFLSALSLLSRGFSDVSYRAQCITGPYGSGKSALALYFTKLLDHSHSENMIDRARRYLGESVGKWLPPCEQGYITILATGARESLSASLIRSLKRSLQQSGRQRLLRELLARHESTIESGRGSPYELISLFESLSRCVVEMKQGLGIIIVVDELGKLLEYSALYPEESDIQLLQELAEAASRSYEYPIWVITILHQQFSQYASRLGRRHQQEWAKVQQRFYDVPLVLDNVDAAQLIASALNSLNHERIHNNNCILETARTCVKFAPIGSEEEFDNLCVSSYPIHPTALILLPALFKRYGQNERSLFSFLSADEPFSLIEWVYSNSFRSECPEFYRLPNLFDYVYATLISGAPNPQIAYIWTEVEDSIVRLGNAPQVEIDVLKTISLLELVGEISRVSASQEFLELALGSPKYSAREIASAIQALVEKRLIVFRRFRNGYRLWEGSDVDISERLADAYQTLPLQSVVLSVAKELCPLPPIVARRHTFRTGTLRLMSVVPSSAEELSATIKTKDDYDGRILQCLVVDDEQWRAVEGICQELRDPSLVVLLGKENDELVEAARDVAALEWIKKNTPALASDRVARRELNERRLEAEIAFRSEWNRVFGSDSSEVVCYWQGKKYSNLSPRYFTDLLSQACDATFPCAPMIRNELINRRHLSSSSAAARRRLIEAMIMSGHLTKLGIEGYPPERSIYESLFVKTDIHREGENGSWVFGRPNDADPGLQKAWDYILRAAHSDRLEPKSVSELFRELGNSPYGVTEGVLPVLLCACLIANNSTMAMYEDRTFVPDLTVPVMERLIRSPDRFAVLAYGLSGDRSAVIERFAHGFDVDVGVLPVIRSLYARMSSLPRYTEIAKDLPPKAIAVREAILRAKSPERLLFVDLPIALGVQPFRSSSSQMIDDENVEVFFSQLNKVLDALIKCYPRLLERVKRGILEIFDVATDSRDWKEIISKRALKLCEAVTDMSLRTVILRACDSQIDDIRYLESVAAGIVGPPPSQWSKVDEENFTRLVPQLALQLRSVESVQYLQSTLEDGEDGYILTISDRNGQNVHRIIRFSYGERKKIDELVRRFIGDVDLSEDPRILLASIAEAANRLIRSQTMKKEDSNNPGSMKNG